VAGDERFGILFVCTGNICRSAAAERLTRAGLTERLGPDMRVDVTSAGTHGVVGDPIDPDTVTALLAHGGDPAGFVARELAAEHLVSVDLVLTATRQHRSAVARLAPGLSRNLFTIREFDRLAAAVDPAALPRRASGVARMRAAVDEAFHLRGMVLPPARPSDDDIEDPYTRGAAMHAKAVQSMATALQRPLDLLAAAYTRRL
jgi:protein-tyrosine phosphatase